MRQQLKRQGELPLLGILDHDLRQYDVGQVFAGAPAHHADFDAIADHAGNVLQLHVAAVGGVVKAAVAVFADENFRLFHGLLPGLQTVKTAG